MRFGFFVFGSVLLVVSLVDFFAMGSLLDLAGDIGAFILGAVTFWFGFHDSPTKYG